MRHYLLLFVLATAILTGCNQEKLQLRKSIEELETAVEQSPDPNKYVELERSYIKYADKYGGDKEMSGRYLYRAAGINYRIQNYKKAAELLEREAKDFKSSSITPSAVLLLADIYDRFLRQPDKAKENYQFFKDNYPNEKGIEKAELYFKPLNEKLAYQIEEQEKVLYKEDKTLNQAAVSELRRLLNQYVSQVKDDPEGVSKYLFRTAEIHLASDNALAAKLTLERILGDEMNKYKVAESYLMVADVLENDTNEPAEAKKYAETFIEKFPDHAKVEEARFYLKPLREKLDTKIAALEEEIFSKDKSARINRRLANQLIGKYDLFAKEFPKDKMTPDYLYKAGEIARSISDFSKALDYWAIVYDKYKSFEKAPQALFLQGFIYENDFNDLEKAKVKYNEFIKKFPKHELADDVKFSLDNLGKSPEEIIKSFENKEGK